ncbi:hypothetical protein BS47DRAFT_115339 [Hydnum rufescens UP504]|uniref:Uncharacterized protein n=1 Tax=Hydnum rufescens UP504 TaxID=1448309 RepID=A0A9P6DPB5_9AGAM|nr:hypothetical protein BS47DRAFT_115339 [Hydnum rufescens UP504]
MTSRGCMRNLNHRIGIDTVSSTGLVVSASCFHGNILNHNSCSHILRIHAKCCCLRTLPARRPHIPLIIASSHSLVLFYSVFPVPGRGVHRESRF